MRLKNKTYKISLTAAMVAITIVFARIGSVMVLGGSVRIGFGNIPVILGGLILGPVYGGLIGGIADLLGFMLRSEGSFHLGITVTSILIGVIPGCIQRKFKIINTRTVILAVVTTVILCSFFIQSLWLSQMQGLPYPQMLLKRAIPVFVVGIVHTIILIQVVPLLKRANIIQDRNKE